MRVGMGYDVHRLSAGRKLIIGGVEIPYEKGLLGHSDADVLLHAIMDALLGAAALGDIGKHFPDTSDEFRGIDSKVLLSRTMGLVSSAGYRVGNVDITIALQRPKLAPYIPLMRETLAGLMNVPAGSVSVKATTTERLGFVGREEGCEVYASALLLSLPDEE